MAARTVDTDVCSDLAAACMFQPAVVKAVSSAWRSVAIAMSSIVVICATQANDVNTKKDLTKNRNRSITPA